MKRKKGQDITEWAIIVALISVVTMTTMFMFVPRMTNILDYISKSISNVANQQ